MVTKYRVTFIDNYGQGVIECDTYERYVEVLRNLCNDPQVEDFWGEYYDDEEGWQG